MIYEIRPPIIWWSRVFFNQIRLHMLDRLYVNLITLVIDLLEVALTRIQIFILAKPWLNELQAQVWALLSMNPWHTRNNTAIRVHLLVIKMRVTPNKHRRDLPLHIFRPCDISHPHLVLRVMVIDLSFDYLKLIDSVLGIISGIGTIYWILYTLKHCIIVSGYILLG